MPSRKTLGVRTTVLNVLLLASTMKASAILLFPLFPGWILGRLLGMLGFGPLGLVKGMFRPFVAVRVDRH